jgi:2-hydroxy-6-oxonona-2,4-dienedioate hydrolase
MTGINAPLSFADVAGIRTAYYRKGATPQTAMAPHGNTLVLLHGGAPGACSDLNWFRNFDVLVEAGYDVVAYDQPGFGHSSVPEDHTIEFRYRHAASFIKSLGLRSVHLIGNSIGGLLSTLLCHRLADDAALDIKSLVLAAPFPYFNPPESATVKLQQHRTRLGSIQPTFESIRSLCLNTFSQAEQVTDDIVSLRLSMLQGDRWSAYEQRGKAGREFDQTGIGKARLTVPTLMVWGLNDRSLPRDIGVEAFDYFVNGQFLFLPNCGHWPQTEHASTFNKAVLQFLDAQRQR